MATIESVVVSSWQLSTSQKHRITELQEECFGRVSRKEIAECFIAESFGWVFAYEAGSIIGQLELYSRLVSFEGTEISLGGLGGTCVTASSRRKSVGKALVIKGLEILREKGCDVACLNADVKAYPLGGLYHQLGFRLMRREISFEDVHGKVRFDDGEMFIPIGSYSIYDLVMNSGKTFHLGRGYW